MWEQRNISASKGSCASAPSKARDDKRHYELYTHSDIAHIHTDTHTHITLHYITLHAHIHTLHYITYITYPKHTHAAGAAAVICVNFFHRRFCTHTLHYIIHMRTVTIEWVNRMGQSSQHNQVLASPRNHPQGHPPLRRVDKDRSVTLTAPST